LRFPVFPSPFIKKPAPKMTANIPEILLLCKVIDFITAFNDALRTAWPDHNPEKLKITSIN
jgi:hypothetical protein